MTVGVGPWVCTLPCGSAQLCLFCPLLVSQPQSWSVSPSLAPISCPLGLWSSALPLCAAWVCSLCALPGCRLCTRLGRSACARCQCAACACCMGAGPACCVHCLCAWPACCARGLGVWPTCCARGLHAVRAAWGCGLPAVRATPFYCEVPTPGPTRRWSPSSPPGSLDGSPHSLGYPPAHRVSFASAGIRTRHQELKVLREASLLPTEQLAQLVAGMLP